MKRLKFIIILCLCAVSNLSFADNIDFPEPISDIYLYITANPLPIPEDIQACKVELMNTAIFNSKFDLVSMIEDMIFSTQTNLIYSTDPDCNAIDLLCIYTSCSENRPYIFKTVNDIPEISTKGECEEYVIKYDRIQ